MAYLFKKEDSDIQMKKEIEIPFRMFIEGNSFQEIAIKLNLPVDTVKKRIFSARKMLIKWIISVPPDGDFFSIWNERIAGWEVADCGRFPAKLQRSWSVLQPHNNQISRQFFIPREPGVLSSSLVNHCLYSVYALLLLLLFFFYVGLCIFDTLSAFG